MRAAILNKQLDISSCSVLSLTMDRPATEQVQILMSVQHECKVMKSTVLDTIANLMFLDECQL